MFKTCGAIRLPAFTRMVHLINSGCPVTASPYFSTFDFAAGVGAFSGPTVTVILVPLKSSSVGTFGLTVDFQPVLMFNV